MVYPILWKVQVYIFVTFGHKCATLKTKDDVWESDDLATIYQYIVKDLFPIANKTKAEKFIQSS